MTSQPGEQTITLHIFPIVSRSKDNQTIKFGQLIEYNKRNIFLQNYAKNETGRIVSDLFSFFKKAPHEMKASGMKLSFNIFCCLQFGIQ